MARRHSRMRKSGRNSEYDEILVEVVAGPFLIERTEVRYPQLEINMLVMGVDEEATEWNGVQVMFVCEGKTLPSIGTRVWARVQENFYREDRKEKRPETRISFAELA
jgi:hypothetical protein